MTPQCVGICLQLSTPFQIQGRACSLFHRKFRLFRVYTFKVRGGAGGAAAPPPAYVLSIPGLSVFAALVSPCLPVRVPRVLCCVGAISATSHVRCTKSHEKKTLNIRQDREGCVRLSPRFITQQYSDCDYVGAVAGLAALAAAGAALILSLPVSDMREFCVAERCCISDGKVRTCTLLPGVAPIGARVAACWLLLCCSLCAGRVFPTSTSIMHDSDTQPSLRIKAPKAPRV